MPSLLKKTMVYLGLIDDEYDDYGDDYEDRGSSASGVRVSNRATGVTLLEPRSS